MKRSLLIRLVGVAALLLLLGIVFMSRRSPPPTSEQEPTPGPTIEETAARAAPVVRDIRRNMNHPTRPEHPGPAIHLNTGTIAPDPSDISALPPVHERPTARGYPWMVLFDGPIRPEWRSALEEAGATIRAVLPVNALLIEAPAAALPAIRRLPSVAWSGEYRPEHKIQRLLGALARQTPDMPVPVTLQTFDPGDAPPLSRHLRDRGASAIRSTPARRWGLLRAVLPAGRAVELAKLPEVQWVEYHEPPRLLNDLARSAAHLNLDAVHDDHDLDGSGQIVAIADTGLDSGDTNTLHPDFAGRLLHVFDTGRLTNWSDTYYHGTHVAGSLLGSGAASGGQFRGAAPEAQLVFQSIMRDNSTLALPDDLNEFYAPPYGLGARIHSDSWGSAAAGAYSSDSMTTDEFVWDHPDMLIVFAAGNDGVDADLDGVVDLLSLDAPASAKNVLAVGASEIGRPPGSGGYSARTYGSAWPLDYRVPPVSSDYISSSPGEAAPGMAAYSSRGPAADGRTKPDIVAPGTDIVSVRSRASSDPGWGILSANTNYAFMGGTSMSTPLAAGAATLIRQHAVDRLGLPSPSAALLKAALAGGARSLSPGQYGTGAQQEIPSDPRPNVVEGWGELDVAGTLYPAPPAQAVLMEGPEPLPTGGEFTFSFRVITNHPLNVVLAYSDYPSALSASIHLVNNLDLLLLDPGGNPLHPNGLDGPDDLNNLEGIDVESPEPGIWTLRVTAANVPEGPQPFALYMRGAVLMPIDISHTPLENTIDTESGYPVSADVTSAGPVDPSAVRLVWIASTGSSGFSNIVMSTTNGIRFEAVLPPHPVGTRLWYYLSAGPPEFPAVHPAGAPVHLHTFEVTPPIPLSVAGNPADVLAADPAYGLHALASNRTIQASALFPPLGTNGFRTACIGWTGTGSVPATGSTASCTFTLTEDSSLTWLWQEQVALTQISSPAGALATLTWHPRNAPASTRDAPDTHMVSNSLLSFAGWQVDGERFPSNGAPSRARIDGIPMPAPRTAVALYLPESLDSDSNGLPDWFEHRYFGQTGQDRYADPDGDGFENELEAADHTDPLDSLSVPSAPVIVHDPLPSPVPTPAPWTLSAAITDNHHVASATLHWQRNGGLWRSAAMVPAPEDPSIFTAQIPSPARDGDTMAYRLSAADAAGFLAQSPVWTAQVAYARMLAEPATLEAHLPAAASTNRHLFIWNTGSQPLQLAFSIIPVGFADDVESGTNGWSRPDGNTDWHISAQNAHSPVHAWYCGVEATRTYRDATHASLVSPPLLLGAPSPRLEFRHWARLEFDDSQSPDGQHYWDSGVMEISGDDGLSWSALIPEGGYPGLITSNPVSPFAPDTPCFADTDGWEPVRADLSGWAGRTVRLRFRFGADHYVVNEGWRIDDIHVFPFTESFDWISLPVTNAVAPAGLGIIVPVALDTSMLPPMGSGQAALRIDHNDPEQPSPLIVPVALFNSTRRVLVSSDGAGQGSPDGETWVQDGQPFSVEFEAQPGFFIADIQTNSAPAPLPEVVSTQTLHWASLASNLQVHAVFAPLLEESSVPLDWLAFYGLTSRNWMAEASLDQDGDGLLTWQEEQVGSHPVDPADAPLVVRILPPAGPGGDWRISWHAYTNQDAFYSILASPNPASGFAPFTNIPAAPPVMTSPPLPPDLRFFGIRRP